MFGNIGATELLLIFLVVLLVFGAKRIPEIARGMGRGIREFKDATSDIKRELTVQDTPPPPGQIQPPTYVRSDPQVYAQSAPPAPQPGYGPLPQAKPSAPSTAAPGSPPQAPPPADGQHPQS